MYSTSLAILQMCDHHHNAIARPNSIEMLNTINNQSLEKLRDSLKEKLDYYKSENNALDSTLNKLHLNRNELLCESQVRLSHMRIWQDLLKTKQCTSEAMSLSYLNHLKHKNNFNYRITTIKNSTEVYNKQLIKVFKQLRESERYLEDCKEEFNNDTLPSKHDIALLKRKIDVYKRELKKFEDGNAWLQDKKLNLEYLLWETQNLNYLKSEKDMIAKELERFQGLSPDVYDAAKQLEEMEHNCKEYWRKLTEYK